MRLNIRRLFFSIPPKTRFALRLGILVVSFAILVVVLNAINLNLIENKNLGGDFLTHWLSIKLFLAREQDPYSVEVRKTVDEYAVKILGWNSGVSSGTAFLLPIYGFIIYLPFLFFDSFAIAYSWWITILELSIFFVGYISFKILKKDTRKGLFIFLLLVSASLANVYALFLIRDGQVLPITLVLFLLGILAMKNEADELAGVLFAFSSISYFQLWLPLLFIVFWSFRQRRSKLAGWFFGTILLLGVSSALLMPEWLLYFSRGVIRFFQENPLIVLPKIMEIYYPGTFDRIGMIVIIVTGIVLLVEWTLAKRRHFAPFYWTLGFTLLGSFLFTPMFLVSNLFLCVPGLGLILLMWNDRWGKKGYLVATLIWIVFLAYPWFIESNKILMPSQKIFWQLIPVILFFFGNFYWIRWWLFRNTDLWFEDAYSLDNSGGDRY